MTELRDLATIGLSMWAVMAATVAAVAAVELYKQARARRDAAELAELERLSAEWPEERAEVTPEDLPLEPTPIFDALVAEWDTLQEARLRALREPTAAFWSLVAATDWTCEHCVTGDHVLCPGCECGCTLVGLEAVSA